MPIPGRGLAPAAGPVFDEVVSLTRRALSPRLIVQTYYATPSLFMLLGASQRSAGGMAPITIPVQGNSMVQGAWVGYSGAFNQPQIIPGVQNAQFNTSFFTVPIPLVLGEAVAQSTEAIIPIIDARMNDAFAVTVQQMGSGLYTNNGANALMPDSFFNAFDNGTNAPVYGGIDRSLTANAFWRGNLVTGAGGVDTRAALSTYLIQATDLAGGESPDFVIMSPSDFAALNAQFIGVESVTTLPSKQYSRDTDVRSGFPNININGVPFFLDHFCPKGTIYMVNTKYFAMYVNENAQFDFDGFYSLIPLGQFAKVGVSYVAYNVICSKPLSGFAITGITGQPF